jgi:hypothetical protein
MAWTTPRTWVTGETVTAAQMNAHVRDNFNDIAFLGHMVRDEVRDTTGDVLATTEAVEQTVTLTIPASWSGYEINAWWSGDIYESGTITAARNVNGRIRMTNASGTTIGLSIIELGTGSPSRLAMTIVGHTTGLTATGAVVVVFTAECSAEGNQMSWDNGSLVAHAYRTS